MARAQHVRDKIMQEERKAKYNKEELLTAFKKASTYQEKQSKEEILDEIWKMLIRQASRGECIVTYRLGKCRSFVGSLVDEQIDKLYFFIRTELEKIGHFLFQLDPVDSFFADLTIEWDHRFL